MACIISLMHSATLPRHYIAFDASEVPTTTIPRHVYDGQALPLHTPPRATIARWPRWSTP